MFFKSLHKFKRASTYAIGAGAAFLTLNITFRTLFPSPSRTLPTEYRHKVYTDRKPSSPSEIPTRTESLAKLKSGETFDVLVIGGGCTGSGVALECATRGLNVALIEQNDFSSGTSSRSTKLIHGGVRYLEKAFKNLDFGQMSLVIESLGERKHLLCISPNLSYEVPIIIPLYHRFPEILFYIPYFWSGMKLYDFLSGSKNRLSPSHFMPKNKVIENFPMLNPQGLKGAIVYYDGIHNDARMNISIALTAAQKGAAVTNHTELVEVVKNVDGRVCGAIVRDRHSGDEFRVRCKAIINATGAFSDNVRRLGEKNAPKIIEPSGGVHVVLPKSFCSRKYGMLIPHTDDNRLLFLMPWEGSTIAGTTDSSCEIKQNPQPKKEEVAFILKELKKFVNSDLTVEDVNASWSGIRPLVVDHNSADTASISRSHVIKVSKNGMITISGGKWTTYRKMAEDVVDCLLKENDFGKKVISYSVTKMLPLFGSSGWSLGLKDELISKGLKEDIAEHLSHNYGFFAYNVADIGFKKGFEKRIAEGYPFIEAEIIFGIKYEYAMTAEDIIARRMRLAFLNREAALKALPRVIEIMAGEKKWDSKKRVEEYFSAFKFLETMNVSDRKRHFWNEKITAKDGLKEIEKAFGKSPLSENEIHDFIQSNQFDKTEQFKIEDFEKLIENANFKNKKIDLNGVKTQIDGMKRAIKPIDALLLLSGVMLINEDDF